MEDQTTLNDILKTLKLLQLLDKFQMNTTELSMALELGKQMLAFLIL